MQTKQDGISIVEAAKRLGITPEVVRKRLQRGKLPGYKQDNRWIVLLPQQDAGQTASSTDQDTHQDAGRTDQDRHPALERLITRYESEIGFLRSELSSRTEELRRKDVLLAQFAERLPELPPPSPSAATSAPLNPWWKFWAAR